MGIRANRYKVMVPTVTGALRLRGRAHAQEARVAHGRDQCPTAERRMIWNGKADRQQSHVRADQPFALTQG